jgi:hypothetical protein
MIHRKFLVVHMPISLVLQSTSISLIFSEFTDSCVVVLSNLVIVRDAVRIGQKLVGVSD